MAQSIVALLCNLQYAAEMILTGTAFSNLPSAQASRNTSATFLTSQHAGRCQWLAGLTIDPSHHIKVSISAARFIVGPHPERAELSTALGDARKSDKC